MAAFITALPNKMTLVSELLLYLIFTGVQCKLLSVVN